MSDNILITQGTSTAIAADNVGNVYFQRIKLVVGGTDIDGGNVSSINPMPVIVSGGTTNIGNIPTVIVSGTLNAVTLISNTTNASVNQISGVTVATGVGATGSGVQRVVMADNMGRTLLTVSGTTNTAVNSNTIIPVDFSNKNKIYALAVSTLSTAQTNVIFTDGTAGSPLWQYVLQAISGANVGANLAVTPPAYLFANSAINTPIVLNITGGTSSPVAYSVSYFKDAT